MTKKLVLTIGVGLFFLFAAAMGYGADWILNSNSNQLPGDLEAKINQAGGTLVRTLDEVGIAVAEFASREDAQAMEAHGLNVMPDLSTNWLPEDQQIENIGNDEPLYVYQWYLPVIEAEKAWDEGVTGTGVRVAVLDTGIWHYHPDLCNIDFAASATFVPGTTDCADDNWHGTHMAGIIAACDNSFGIIGVAPQATLICVKVLSGSGVGNHSWILAGIIHAVNQNADIINLSLGNTISKNGYLPYYTAAEAQAIIKAWRKVINWATSRGSLVVGSAGGDMLDLDHDGNLIMIPAQIGTAVAVSATAPINQQAFDTPASYTNYGKSSIWVAAPGGDFAAGTPLDGILSTSPGGWGWATGTSPAAAVVSGTAALILSKYGPMSVGNLRNRLAQTADDLGKPGQDEWYGRGRVNAYKAVTE